MSQSKGAAKLIYQIELWDLFFAAAIQGLIASGSEEWSVERAAQVADQMLEKSIARKESEQLKHRGIS